MIGSLVLGVGTAIGVGIGTLVGGFAGSWVGGMCHEKGFRLFYEKNI